MSNNYDIDIQMDYFLSGDDYYSSLEGLKKFKDSLGFENGLKFTFEKYI